VHPTRFDRLARSLTVGTSRRSALALAAGVVGLASSLPDDSSAKKKNKKAKPNEFGCLNVGQPCRGKSTNCCSGICQGKKPKKGKRDKSRCVGHNEGLCTPELNVCTINDPALSVCNTDAVCLETTGRGVFCGTNIPFSEAGNCRACSRDTDCVAFGFPPGSACALITACGSCAATGFRACFPPGS
jgi:hypothetical protein